MTWKVIVQLKIVVGYQNIGVENVELFSTVLKTTKNCIGNSIRYNAARNPVQKHLQIVPNVTKQLKRDSAVVCFAVLKWP